MTARGQTAAAFKHNGFNLLFSPLIGHNHPPEFYLHQFIYSFSQVIIYWHGLNCNHHVAVSAVHLHWMAMNTRGCKKWFICRLYLRHQLAVNWNEDIFRFWQVVKILYFNMSTAIPAILLGLSSELELTIFFILPLTLLLLLMQYRNVTTGWQQSRI